MDVSTQQFLWSQSISGYLGALAVFVAAVLFGALIVRSWQSPPPDRDQ